MPRAPKTKASKEVSAVEAPSLMDVLGTVHRIEGVVATMQSELQRIARAASAPASRSEGATLAAVEQALASIGLPPGQFEAAMTTVRAQLAKA